jgi:hypothetical protein
MYEQKRTESANEAVASSRETKSSVLDKQLASILMEQAEMISVIEEQCHALLNLRSPKSDPTDQKMPNITDFFGAMNEKCLILQNHNTRLNGIYKHLKEII